MRDDRKTGKLQAYCGASVLGGLLVSLAAGGILTFATAHLNGFQRYVDVAVLWAYLQLPLLGVAAVAGTLLGLVQRVYDALRGKQTSPGACAIAAAAVATGAIVGCLALSVVQARLLYFDEYPWVTTRAQMLPVVGAYLAAVLALGLVAFFLTRRVLALALGPNPRIRWRRAIVVGVGLSAFFHAVYAAGAIAIAREVSPSVGEPARPARHETGRRVVVLGIDGATFRIMNPLLDQGMLPHFQEVMSRGAWGYLGTLTPSNSPILWTTIATGVRRERHGIMNFLVQHPRGMSEPVRTFPSHLGLNTSLLLSRLYGRYLVDTYPVTADLRRAATVWEIASAYRLRVGVVNWWPSWPAEEINGFIISNQVDEFLKVAAKADPRGDQRDDRDPSAGLTWPRELLATIQSKVEAHHWRNLGDRQLMELSIDLYRSYRPDLFLLYLGSGVDGAQHDTWDAYQPELFGRVDPDYVTQHQNAIPDMYRRMDEILGKLLEAIGEDTTLLIVSDHGGSPFFSLDPWSEWKGGHEHAPAGVLMAVGPGIRRGARCDTGSILDVTPTVLALLGLPRAESMQGGVIADILDPTVVQDSGPSVGTWDHLVRQSRPSRHETLAHEEEEKLKALGYIR